MSLIYSDISIKNQEKENRLKRIKEAKDLDIYWSKQIAQANRENEEIKKQQEEYKGAVEQYKNIILMIEELKRNKEQYIQRQAESEIEKEREKQRQYEEMLRAEEKKRKFEVFLKQKGIEASNYLKDMQEKKNREHEELHRCEKKKQTKYEENLKTKKLIDNYIIKKEKEIYEEQFLKQQYENNNLFENNHIIEKINNNNKIKGHRRTSSCELKIKIEGLKDISKANSKGNLISIHICYIGIESICFFYIILSH